MCQGLSFDQNHTDAYTVNVSWVPGDKFCTKGSVAPCYSANGSAVTCKSQTKYAVSPNLEGGDGVAWERCGRLDVVEENWVLDPGFVRSRTAPELFHAKPLRPPAAGSRVDGQLCLSWRLIALGLLCRYPIDQLNATTTCHENVAVPACGYTTFGAKCACPACAPNKIYVRT